VRADTKEDCSVLKVTALVKYVPELADRRFAADFTVDRVPPEYSIR